MDERIQNIVCLLLNAFNLLLQHNCRCRSDNLMNRTVPHITGGMGSDRLSH